MERYSIGEKGRDDEEKDISSYIFNINTIEDTGN
jgi:hypothetical protein